MKTHIAILSFLLAVTLFSLAKDETLEQLIERANAAQPARPDLFLEVADRELKSAIEAYKANKLEDGRAALRQLVNYADKAHALALHSGKKLPQTEIKIRRISNRLRDLKLSVEADQQLPIEAAIDQLEDFRTALLKGMFSSKTPSEKK